MGKIKSLDLLLVGAILFALVGLALMCSGCSMNNDEAFAASVTAKIPPDRAIRALIGEAGGQDDTELLAHAYTLKNRGTLRGVYGIRSKWARHPDKKTWTRAKNAWGLALMDRDDPMEGRTEWRSVYDLKLMALRGETIKTEGLYDGVKIGDTYFFKKVAPKNP